MSSTLAQPTGFRTVEWRWADNQAIVNGKRGISPEMAVRLAAAFGLVPLAVGVAAHEGSTVVVCLNSLRLLFGKNE